MLTQNSYDRKARASRERRQFIQHQAKSFVNKILYGKVEIGKKINGRRINQGNKSNWGGRGDRGPKDFQRKEAKT